MRIKNLLFLGFFILNFQTIALAIKHRPIKYECPGQKSNSFESWDYNKVETRKLIELEKEHFDINVATLDSGVHAAGPEQDLNYTLQVVPNHHRALDTLVELSLRHHNSSNIPGIPYVIPCYFQRAKQIAPYDGVVDSIYAKYLARTGFKEQAIVEIQSTLKKSPNSPKAIYNLGLAYFYMNDIPKAREFSIQAKKLGHSASGLEHLISEPSKK